MCKHTSKHHLYTYNHQTSLDTQRSLSFSHGHFQSTSKAGKMNALSPRRPVSQGTVHIHLCKRFSLLEPRMYPPLNPINFSNVISSATILARVSIMPTWTTTNASSMDSACPLK